MSFFDKFPKKSQQESTPSTPLDRINGLDNLFDDVTKTTQAIQKTLQTQSKLSQETQNLLAEQAKMKSNLQTMKSRNPDLMEGLGDKPSQSNDFLENHRKETGSTVNVIDEGDGNLDTSETQSVDKAEDVKDEEQKPVEPLLNVDVIDGLGDKLKKVIFGQNDVIDAIETGLVVSTVGLNLNPDKPAGCYMFAGPSGVGKTELSLQLSKLLDVPILVLNMGEHGLEQDVTKLIGVASGYVGYSNGGLLTNFVRENPRCVIVFDEIEKAHPSINKILLSILDKGVCRDNKNREVFFKNTIVIATTNLGANIEYMQNLTEDQKFERRMAIIKDKLATEIINRYDRIFQFKPLSKENYSSIVSKFFGVLNNLCETRNNFKISATKAMIDFSTDNSIDPSMGGRPARRFIEQIVTNPLAFKLLNKEFMAQAKEHGEVVLDIKKGKIVLKIANKIVSTFDKTEKLLEEYNKSKFTNKVQEEKEEKPEIDQEALSHILQSVAPDLAPDVLKLQNQTDHYGSPSGDTPQAA